MTVKYFVKAADFGGNVDSDVSMIYDETFELVGATTNEEAIALAEKVQDEHDAKARELLEGRPDAEDQYNFVPCYVNHIFRVSEDEEGNEYEEAVAF